MSDNSPFGNHPSFGYFDFYSPVDYALNPWCRFGGCIVGFLVDAPVALSGCGIVPGFFLAQRKAPLTVLSLGINGALRAGIVQPL